MTLMSRQGFTFVEILISAVVMTFLGGVAVVMAQASGQLWNRTDVRMTAISDTQRVMNHLVEDLTRASRTDIVCTPGADGNPLDDQISFFLAPRASGIDVSYSVNGARELVRAQGVSAVTVAPNMTAFVPTCSAGGLIDLMVATQASTELGGDVTQQVQSRVFVKSP
jgi:Tfp pilus assembly protein PilE